MKFTIIAKGLKISEPIFFFLLLLFFDHTLTIFHDRSNPTVVPQSWLQQNLALSNPVHKTGRRYRSLLFYRLPKICIHKTDYLKLY